VIPHSRLGMAWRFVLCGVLLVAGAAATTAVAGLLQVKTIVGEISVNPGIVSKQISLPKPGAPQTILLIGSDHRAGEPFRTAGLCLYRDGRDSVAWHGDTIGRGKTEDTMVAIVSLGSPRALTLRPRGGGPARRYELGHGDLIVMGGSCQRTWEHAVPKTARPVGPRISVQFRPRGVR